MQAQTRRGSGAIKWGLIFGIVLGVLNGLRAAFVLLPGARVIGALGGGEIILALAAYFLAGLFAGRQSRSIGVAAVAGLIAAVVAEVIGGAVSLTIFAAAPHAYALMNGFGPRAGRFGHPILLVALIVRLILTLLTNAVIGAGVGALGGLAGRGDHPAAAQVPQNPPSAHTPPE